MKKLALLIIVAVAFTAAPVLAGPQLTFATAVNGADSWTFTVAGSVKTISFQNMEVKTSSSGLADLEIRGDIVALPDMSVTGVTAHVGPFGDYYTAVLTPIAPAVISITDAKLVNNAGTVFSGTLGMGGFLVIGADWLGYSAQKSDITAVTGTSGYSDIIDELLVAYADGAAIDLSFSGDPVTSTIYSLLQTGNDGVAAGSISGQINAIPVNAIPAPGAIVLGSLGTALVGYLRRRKAL